MRASLLRYSIGRIPTASSSRTTYCPQAILQWRQDLAFPLPSSQKLLGSLHQAMQSPLPPLHESQGWIQAQDVEESLTRIFAKEALVAADRDKLDLIFVGAERCLRDAIKRAFYQAEMHKGQGEESLSDTEKKEILKFHPSIMAWKRILKSHNLLLNRLRSFSNTRRKPYFEDLRTALRLILYKRRPLLTHHHQLLRLFLKLFPTSFQVEDCTLNEIGLAAHQLQLYLGKSKTDHAQAQRLFDLVLDREGQIRPQHMKELFEVIYNRTLTQFGQDATLLHLAIMMEGKLAAWRLSIREYELDPFEPVRVLMRITRRLGFVQNKHLNAVLWIAIRYRPDDADHIGWPSIDDCVAIYEEMRSNALWIEMEYEENAIKPPIAIYQINQNATSKARIAFGLERGLPIHAIPDQVTFEILIQGLTWQGELKRATKTLLDMTRSPKDTFKRWLAIKNDYDRISDNFDSPMFEANITTFDSFFKGFCKHGKPSTLSSVDLRDSEKSNGRPFHHKDHQDAWNIDALNSLLDAYLSLNAKACRLAQIGLYSIESSDTTSPSSKVETRRENDPDWLRKMPYEEVKAMGRSILSLENPVDESDNICQAPSCNQLFNVLTALRRVSNDDVSWVLRQWQRIKDKFSIIEGDRRRLINGKEVNYEGWYGFRMNARLQSIIENLEEKEREEE